MIRNPNVLHWLPLLLLLLGCSSSTVHDSSFHSTMDVPSPNLPGAPLIPAKSVLRPYVKTGNGQIPAGEAAATAFVASIDGAERPIVLTALRILESGKFFSGRPNPSSLNLGLESITLSDAFGSMDGVVSAFAFIDIPEAGFDDDPNAKAGDLLAIQLGNKNPFRSFVLSEALPSLGEKVWLSAAVFEGASPSQRQHEAIITKVDRQGYIQYRIQNESLSLKGTLGAPILNADGKVMAIHLGSLDPVDPLLAVGNPVSRFLPYLLSAVNKGTNQQVKTVESN